MGKGRYLKSAERACSRKSRFETRAAAEAFVEARYRAYRCVVCGGFHLTSGRGDRREPVEPTKREPSGPKLGDLDWSAVLGPPKVKKVELPELSSPSAIPEATKEESSPRRTAECLASPGRDGRILLLFEGKLTKSKPVRRGLRDTLDKGMMVELDPILPGVVLGLA